MIPLITYPNIDRRKTLKYRMEKKGYFWEKMSRKATEHSTSSESIMERDNGYLSLLCNTVIKHSNNKKGIKDYIQKVLNTCLLVMYAINNSNLNLSLDRHVQTHARSTFTCSTCLQSFKKENHLKYHEERRNLYQQNSSPSNG